MDIEIFNIILNASKLGITLILDGDDLLVEGRTDLLTPDLISQLRQKKPQLIRYLRNATLQTSSIQPRPSGASEICPLSFAQQRIWFLDQFDTNNAFYNMAASVRLSGKLDGAALHQTLNEVVRRHQVLRTRFGMHNDEPIQIVVSMPDLPLPMDDLSHLPPNVRDVQACRATQTEAETPFDLAKGPVIRTRLLKLAEQEHILLFTVHHIAADGWSMGVLVQEVAALYTAYSRQLLSPLPEMALQYADFALWQRSVLKGEVLDAQLAYWRERLDKAPALLVLPTDRPRPAQQSHAGAHWPFSLSAATTARLHDLSQQADGTLFMTLASAFKVLLSRYSGQTDICLGTPVANRNRGEIESLIGFFVNTLVLRSQLDGNPSFRSLLQQVRGVALSAYMHQDVPFEQLVEAFKPERHASHAPLFQVMLVLQNTPMSTLELPNLTLQIIPTNNATSKYDLTLDVTEQDGQLQAHFEYSTDLFDESTIARMARHFVTLLDAIAANPDAGIQDLPLLDQTEQTRLLHEWNSTAAPYPATPTMQQLFEAQAEQTPDHVALVFEKRRLTYRELNLRANQLAHHLRRLGAKPDARVAICMARSLEMVIAVLATLKAGAAYVPLDPTFPADRLAYMLDDADPVVLLTQQSLLSALPTKDVRTFCMDSQWAGLATEAAGNPVNLTLPEHLAYVIYTSGSTGRPKGISMPTRALVNLLEWSRTHPPKASRALAFASLSFDASFHEIFTSLHSGGTLYVASEPLRTDVHALGEYLVRERIEAVTLPVVILQLLAHANSAGSLDLRALRDIIATGEALFLTQEIIAMLRANPRLHLHNHYGPSETHVVTAYTLRLEHDAALALPPSIGTPINNTQIYLLDDQLRPMPIGVAGELYIAGDGLAHGYVNRPDLTAERFIPNPFAVKPGMRMYKSGDLARFLADGHIEYLGRIDHQVKLRGFRIELGEIETALAAMPEVLEAIVLMRSVAPDDKRLVAYVVPVAEMGDISASTLRGHLAQSLPDYMVPSHFVLLDALPLTSNGKIDRKALPEPELHQSTKRFQPPRTHTEEILTHIWAEVLKMDRVGIDDNFFDLGGHSLLATQVISRVRNAFQIDLALRVLFETPTLAELAYRVEQAIKEQAKMAAPPILPIGRDTDLPVSFAQQRLWFLDQLEPGGSAYNMAGALRLCGRLDLAALLATLNHVVRRHEALRTVFASVGGVPRQIILPELKLTLPVIDLDAESDAGRQALARRLMNKEATTPFNLASGPLIRARLLRLAEQEQILLFTLHHIVSDGWSLGVLVREVATLYAAHVSEQKVPLPALSVQYADFAAWQRQWLRGDVLNTQLAYWKKQLADAPALLTLPTDHPRPALQTHGGGSHPFIIPATTTKALHALNRQAQSTLFMTLAAALNVLLARYSGQSDICIGTPIANRNRHEIEDLIGFFVNTLILRTRLDGNPTFRALLQQVRINALGAYAHQDIPFEQLVEELNPKRQTSHTPLFQVMLVLQNAPLDTLTLPGLTLQMLHTDNASTKFDLLLDMVERDGTLHASLEYNTDLFNVGTIERMGRHFAQLLAAIVANPDCPVQNLAMLEPAEQTLLLREWNDTATIYPAMPTLQRLFAQQVALTPAHTAVRYDGNELSYAELDARANQLAHHLRGLGLGPDRIAGIYAERGLEMVIGLLAILKAGGAYLPLDPAHPSERLAYMLADAQPVLLLTQQKLLATIPAWPGATFCLDSEWPVLAALPQSAPPDFALPANLAYVIYTSGSTGKPKGVGIDHRGIVNRLQWMQQVCQINGNDRVLQKTPYSFDVSVWEFFLPLGYGATLVLAKPGGHQDPRYLTDLIDAEQVSTLHFVPPMLAVFLQQLQSGECGALRQIICSGEALPHDLAQRCLQQLPHAALLNLYGPTEASVDVSYWACHAASECVPIGKPISNIQLYVLDPDLQPCPIGVVGQLYIAGVGLARGYLQRPDLSAEKFIPNPHAALAGGRMYETGDLCRLLHDGNIEYLGRIDHQVKLRGFRIELGEIEAALTALPAIHEAVVMVREDVSGDKRLVAYLTPQAAATGRQEEPIDLPAEVLAPLARILPEYMIPTHFVELAALPLNANGKVDRKALPAPDTRRSDGDYIAPDNETERQLAQIWAEALKLDRVGRNDNFFVLGGHSLLAIRLVHAINQHFAAQMSLATLFQKPVLSDLAALLDVAPTHVATQTAFPATSIEPDAGRRFEPFPLNDIQQAYWIGRDTTFSLGGVGTHSYLEVRLREFDLSRFGWALNQLILRHDMLRAIFHSDGTQQILAQVPAYRIAQLDLRGQDAASVDDALQKVKAELSHQVLDAGTWPLFELRATLLDHDITHLHISTDALISDAASIRILSSELEQLYSDASTQLVPLTLSFRDYVIAEQALEQSDWYQHALQSWRERLPDLAPAPDLPLARHPESIDAPRFVGHKHVLAKAEWSALKQRAKQNGVTPSALLLSAFGSVLAAWSKWPRLTINLTLFRRLPLHQQVDQVIGDFTSLILLESNPEPKASFLRNTQKLQTRLWQDIDHSAVSGVRLLRELARANGALQTSMPVVFTSTLAYEDDMPQSGPARQRLFNDIVYGISQTPQVWIDHQVSERDGELNLSWDVVEQIFPNGMIADMFAAYCALLTRLANDKHAWQQSMAELLRLSDADLALQQAANATATEISGELLHTLFERQALRAPEATAVIAAPLCLSYGELRARARHLGARLQALEARPNQLVALVMAPGWEQILATLGILYSGAAYLPLDPKLPIERMHLILLRAEVRLVLTQAHLLDSIKWPANVTCLALDAAPLPQTALPPHPVMQAPTDLAYVIYTSGSTGLPKGVMIDHQGAVNTVLDINRRFGVTASDRVLAISSLSFDLSVYDIFGTLAAGAAIVILESDNARDPAQWIDLLHRHQVSVWNSVPALLSMLIDYAVDNQQALPTCLRLLMLSGDWIALALPKRVRAQLPLAQIVSLGGATEASIWSIYYPIVDIEPEWRSIPYGKALANQQFYVLDGALEPRPLWVPGELYIGGIGLAKGYWRDEERTLRSFITHPQTGQRLYRTGDFGRYLADGNIEFLGREDSQVKVQGYRIELGEIEAALALHADVAALTINVVGETHGEKHLVAYIVPVEGAGGIDALAMRAFLAQNLPEYMLPAYYVTLDALPLTANGKIDRKALPPPDLSQNEIVYVAPRTGTEHTVVNILAQLLELERIGVEDNFFRLGGHSLLATQIISKLRATFQVTLPLRLMFETKNVAELAKRIDESLGVVHAAPNANPDLTIEEIEF